MHHPTAGIIQQHPINDQSVDSQQQRTTHGPWLVVLRSDCLRTTSLEGHGPSPHPTRRRVDQPTIPTTSEDPAKVYDSFPVRAAVTVDHLVTESGLAVSQVMESLAVLELHDLAGRHGAQWQRIVPADHR